MPTVTVPVPTLRPFRASDATALVNRDGEQCTVAHLLMQARSGPSFTAEVEGRILCAAGMVMPWPGMGQVWMLIGETLDPYGFWISKTVRRVVDDLSRQHRLHRLEAVALVESPRNQQWLEWLGFTSEQQGVAQAYLTDRRSIIRYERIED